MFLLFAAENAEHVSGYAAVAEIFDNNLINWLILMAVLVWLWFKYTPSMFAARKARIDSVLLDASKAKEEGESFLVEQRAKVANAEAEATQILGDAKKLAEELKVQLQSQTEKDIADLKHKLDNQIANERQLAITEMRATAAKASIVLASEVLPQMMNDGVKANLLNQFMEQLDQSTFQRSTTSGLLDAKSVH